MVRFNPVVLFLVGYPLPTQVRESSKAAKSVRKLGLSTGIHSSQSRWSLAPNQSENIMTEPLAL